MLKDHSDSEIADYFKSNLLALRKAIQPQEWKTFATLDSDEERVVFILSYPEAHRLSLKANNVGLKDPKKALHLKDAGNKFFAQGVFYKALETYSNAILLATKEELGVIHANRSAALYHLEKYEHALEDVEEALRVGYRTELVYKIEERRARCFLALKHFPEAMESFRKALKALDYAKITLEKKQKLEADVRIMLAVMDKGKSIKIPQKTTIKNIGSSVPRIVDRNPLYPACSKAVEIRDEGGDVGRHAVATRDIAPGEILVVEKPHCSFLLGEYRLTHCHLCLKRIFAPIAPTCDICSCVAYCSTRCRNADAKVHLQECKLLAPLWISKASITCFLALRAIIQRPFEELMKLKEQLKCNKGRYKVTEKRPYKGRDYETFYGLVTHESERTIDDIFHRAYMASWLLRLLKVSTYLPEEVKTPDSADAQLSEEELFLADLLLHNLQLLQFNSHEISELVRLKRYKTLETARSIFIGGGVYPTVALFNHSCNPGVVRYFIGTTMVVRAIRTIEAGKEISENYGPIFTTTPEDERKRKMRLQYWFDCNCEACTDHWPLLENINPTILRFKCESGPSCGNYLPVNMNLNEFMIKCTKCDKSTNLLKGLKALQDTDALFKVASQNLQEDKSDQALQTYLKILKLIDEVLALPVKDYHLCQQEVRLCMLALGNTNIT